MIYIQYVFLAILQLFIDLISFPLAPLFVLFADKDGNLPAWLAVWQTPDNTLDGDQGYKDQHRFFPANSNWFEVYCNRVGWLWRNPAYGWDMALGCDCQVGDTLIIKGDRTIGDNPFKAGSCKWMLYRNNKVVGFQYFKVMSLTATKCFFLNMGWKLWNAEPYTNAPNSPFGVLTINQANTCQLVFTPTINDKG